MQSIPATAGAGVVQSNLQIVVTQEPIERRPCLFAPAVLSRHAISFQACRNDRASFERLLNEPRFLGLLGIDALRTNWCELTFVFAPLNRCQPMQGLEPGRFHFRVSAAGPRSQEGLRQSGI